MKYTALARFILHKGESNDARNAPFIWTRIEPKAENLVQLIESKVSVVVPFNCDCELRLCRARFSQESLGMFNEVRGIPPRSYWRHLFNGQNIINQWRKYCRCNRCSCPPPSTTQRKAGTVQRPFPPVNNSKLECTINTCWCTQIKNVGAPVHPRKKLVWSPGVSLYVQ